MLNTTDGAQLQPPGEEAAGGSSGAHGPRAAKPGGAAGAGRAARHPGGGCQVPGVVTRLSMS